MKIAIVGDMHLGIKQNSIHMQNQSLKFIKFLVESAGHKFNKIIFMGDMFDNRKTIDLSTMALYREIDNTFTTVSLYDYEVYSLVGNHDLFYKNSSRINSQSLLSNHIMTIDEPTTIHDLSIDIIPWINEENHENIRKFVENSKSRFCFGHFEFTGFKFDKNSTANVKEKISQKLFKDKYEKVFSGHYHIKSEKDNIYYVGTPHQLTWVDHNVKKGYHIFDTDTGELEFVHYDNDIFIEIKYEKNRNYDFTKFTNKYIKVVIEKIEDAYDYDLFYKQMLDSNPADLKLINMEQSITENSLDISDNVNINTDTLEIIEEYIQTDSDKDLILQYIRSCYNKAVLEMNDE